MGSRCLLLLSGLSVLLALSGSDAKNSGAFCPICPEHANCSNSTHCACKDGFQSPSGRRYIKPHEKCEDIDECKVGLAKCKKESYCGNKIGSYYCSCFSNRILNWLAMFMKLDDEACYEGASEETTFSGNIQEILRNNRSKEHIAKMATQIFQKMEVIIWTEDLASPGKHDNSTLGIVYEIKRCNERSEKTVLEAGNNTMDINCTDAFKGTIGGTVFEMDSPDFQILGTVVSFLGDWANLQSLQGRGDSTYPRANIQEMLSAADMIRHRPHSELLSPLQVLCSIVAGVLHYLYLASFTWMFLEGLHLILTIRNLKVANYTSAGKFKKFMYPLGYGIPALIVAVSAIVGPQNYGSQTHCWLKLNKGFIWSFMGPVAVIILINLVLYFQILWILRSKLSSLNKEVSTIQDTRVMTFKAIAQLFILGCSWGLGLFMVEEVGKVIGSVIAYTFTVINVLQGVLLFVVHCLLNRQVRMEYKKWFSGIWKGFETESIEVTHSTTQTKTEEPGTSSEVFPRRDAPSVQPQHQTPISAFWLRT
nr:putative adhesion G protein-coupled receptor E4P [Mirounga angustirostris]